MFPPSGHDQAESRSIFSNNGGSKERSATAVRLLHRPARRAEGSRPLKIIKNFNDLPKEWAAFDDPP
jgi:hypothetical protein